MLPYPNPCRRGLHGSKVTINGTTAKPHKRSYRQTWSIGGPGESDRRVLEIAERQGPPSGANAVRRSDPAATTDPNEDLAFPARARHQPPTNATRRQLDRYR